MRRTVIGATAAALFVLWGGAASAKVETLKGRLIDKACYDKDPHNTSEKHLHKPLDECASTCAKYGLPVGLLTSDGKLYQVVGDLAANKNAKLLPHMIHTVEITGDVTTDADGIMKIAATDLKMIGK